MNGIEIGKVWKYKVKGKHLEVVHYYPSLFSRSFWKGKHILKLKVSNHSIFGYKKVDEVSFDNINDLYKVRDKLVYDYLSKNKLI